MFVFLNTLGKRWVDVGVEDPSESTFNKLRDDVKVEVDVESVKLGGFDLLG